jgi:cytochrome c oxidase cbb3-type subunit 3
LYLFWFLIALSIVYLALYPGLGKFEGVWNWSSAGQYQSEKDRLDAAFNEEFEPFKTMDTMAVAADPKAQEMGKRLYLTYCMQCHGSNGQGDGKNFPNLADAQWLFGGDPDSVKASIAAGRVGEMPANLAGDEQGAKEVANYVLSLGGKPHDAALAAAGQPKYAACAGCHGDNGKGMAAAGFPDLTDDAWQYGSSEAAIVESIVKGRKGGMPAFQEMLGDAKIHLLTAYVWGMGGGQKPAAPVEVPVAEAAPAEAAATPAQ